MVLEALPEMTILLTTGYVQPATAQDHTMMDMIQSLSLYLHS
jgi:hypothetical protein